MGDLVGHTGENLFHFHWAIVGELNKENKVQNFYKDDWVKKCSKLLQGGETGKDSAHDQ